MQKVLKSEPLDFRFCGTSFLSVLRRKSVAYFLSLGKSDIQLLHRRQSEGNWSRSQCWSSPNGSSWSLQNQLLAHHLQRDTQVTFCSHHWRRVTDFHDTFLGTKSHVNDEGHHALLITSSKKLSIVQFQLYRQKRGSLLRYCLSQFQSIQVDRTGIQEGGSKNGTCKLPHKANQQYTLVQHWVCLGAGQRPKHLMYWPACSRSLMRHNTLLRGVCSRNSNLFMAICILRPSLTRSRNMPAVVPRKW